MPKTSVLLFSNRLHFRDIDLRIIMGGVMVDFRESTKFLGLEVDHRLKFSCHLSVITEKLSKVVGVLFKLSHYLPQSALIKLYYSLFYPHVIHANLI